MKHTVIGILLFLMIFIAPMMLHAAGFSNGLTRGIGGRVVAGQTELQAAITCAASYGPFLLAPFTIAVPGPYFIRNATSGFPRVGGYFLGLYNTVPDAATCVNSETGAPIPGGAYGIKIYGVSR